MVRQFFIGLTDKLTDLFIIIGLDRLTIWLWNWNYELTRPEREQCVREFIRRALREDGER